MFIKYGKLFFLFCILVTLLQGCKKSCEENARNYTFKSEVYLSAKHLDTLSVYDTIKLKVVVPFLLRNITDSSLVEISNSKPTDFTIGILNHNIINGVHILKGFEDFFLIPIESTFTKKGTGVVSCTLQKTGQHFLFSIGIIPKKKGLISLQLSSIFGDLSKSCSVYSISNSFSRLNLNHDFYYNLTGGNSSSVLLTERDLFIWVK